MIKVAIIGATGYTGAESIEILLRHPQAELVYLTALSEECGALTDIFPRFIGRCDMHVEPLDIAKLAELADVALCCLPHKVSMSYVPKLLQTGVKVIDFSADYRLKDAAIYEKFYSVKHTDRTNLAGAVFGLPELFRQQIRSARLVANPGCFPTAVLLGLAPLLKNKIIESDGVVASAVSGVSGAGRTPSPAFHFPNMNENLFAYAVGSHRHNPEMEQIASQIAGEPVQILFQPHVGCFDRGILATIYCRPRRPSGSDELFKLYADLYRTEPFVRVLTTPPAVKNVAGTNYCHIFVAEVKGWIVCFSAIDNLVKGASGQAIQNMNIIFGLDETLGLK
jgi:N-acetyl-gamma-glutamyl-phosphate reductase